MHFNVTIRIMCKHTSQVAWMEFEKPVLEIPSHKERQKHFHSRLFSAVGRLERDSQSGIAQKLLLYLHSTQQIISIIYSYTCTSHPSRLYPQEPRRKRQHSYLTTRRHEWMNERTAARARGVYTRKDVTRAVYEKPYLCKRARVHRQPFAPVVMNETRLDLCWLLPKIVRGKGCILPARTMNIFRYRLTRAPRVPHRFFLPRIRFFSVYVRMCWIILLYIGFLIVN